MLLSNHFNYLKMRKILRFLLFCLAVLPLVSCETTAPGEKRTIRTIETKTLKAVPGEKTVEQRFVQEGIASWYGPDFHEKRTANGEIYDMYEMTAAHKSIPFNVYVKVTNLENGKSVVVRINDRGPFVKDRIIDLTHTAAFKLGMLDKGTAPVKINGLGFIREVEGKRIYIAPTTYRIEGTLTLQVASFKSEENAASLAMQLKKGNFPDIHTTELEIGEEKYYRVLVGKYKLAEEAEEDMVRLIKAGFKGTHLLTE